MPSVYVITDPCIDVKDKSCFEVCPVDCIHTSDDDRMCFIDPDRVHRLQRVPACLPGRRDLHRGRPARRTRHLGRGQPPLVHRQTRRTRPDLTSLIR